MKRICCDYSFTVAGKDYQSKFSSKPTVYIPKEECKIDRLEAEYIVIPELENIIIFANLEDYLFYINLGYFHHIFKLEFGVEGMFKTKYADVTIKNTKNIVDVVNSMYSTRKVTTDVFTTFESEENKTLIKMLFVGKKSPNFVFPNIEYVPSKYSHIVAKELDKMKNTKKYYIQNEVSPPDESFVDDDTNIFHADFRLMMTKKIDGAKIMVPVYASFYSDPECCIVNGKPSKKLLANFNYFDIVVINYTPETIIETDNFIEFVNLHENIICFPGSDYDYPIQISGKRFIYDFLKNIPEKTSEKYIHEIIQIDTTVNEKYEKLKRVIKSLNIE